MNFVDCQAQRTYYKKRTSADRDEKIRVALDRSMTTCTSNLLKKSSSFFFFVSTQLAWGTWKRRGNLKANGRVKRCRKLYPTALDEGCQQEQFNSSSRSPEDYCPQLAKVGGYLEGLELLECYDYSLQNRSISGSKNSSFFLKKTFFLSFCSLLLSLLRKIDIVSLVLCFQEQNIYVKVDFNSILSSSICQCNVQCTKFENRCIVNW